MYSYETENLVQKIGGSNKLKLSTIILGHWITFFKEVYTGTGPYP